MATYLIEGGADVNIADAEGLTPLHLTAGGPLQVILNVYPDNILRKWVVGYYIYEGDQRVTHSTIPLTQARVRIDV